MKDNKKIYIKLFAISSSLVLIKYLISYIYFFDEDLFLKILRLNDIEYLMIVESLSRLDLKTDWSNIFEAQKIIGFPLFSVIWHSIFFYFTKYYSILILEIIFFFLICLILLKFIINLGIKKNQSLCIIISLLLIIEILKISANIYGLEISNLIKLPLSEFIGIRFPRPLVTSIYFFSILFCLQKVVDNQNFDKSKKYLIFLSLSLLFLINSFFYLFIVSSILTFFILIKKFKSKIITLFLENLYFFFTCIFIVSVGFLILFVQNYFSEDDYSYRIGLYTLNLNDKIYILKHLFKKIFQLEIIILIVMSLYLKNNYNKRKDIEKKTFGFDILFYLFISSILSPFIFVVLTNKAISLYHFWTIVKFTGFFFVFISIFNLFFKKFDSPNIKKLINFFILLLFFFNIINSLNFEKNSNKSFVKDLNDLKIFLNESNFKNINDSLYTNVFEIKHVWLNLGNRYLSIVEGFSSSQKDTQLEKTIINIFKIFKISSNEFERMLNEVQTDKRNSFSAKYFNYKYTVNSIRHYKPLLNEYSDNEIKIISGLSPLVSYFTIIPKSEKIRMLNNYKKFEVEDIIFPEIIILKKNLNFDYESIYDNYIEIYSNNNFITLKKKIL